MRQLLALILLFIVAPLALADSGYKVEAAGALAEKSVSDAVRAALAEKGVRVVGADGKTLCEVWLRREVPTTKDEPMGAIFGQIPEGELVGVIHFPSGASDYRGQGLKPGYYTMRYALILNDGAHLGVSPTRDFVLLCAPAADTEAKPLSPADLLKFSRQASGTSHPSPWSLVAVESKEGLPKVVKTEENHVVLEVSLPTKAGGMNVGLTLAGKAEG
jgi:hypothetical protein